MESLKAYIEVIDPRLLHHLKGKMGEFIELYRSQHFVSEEAFIAHYCGDKYTRKHYLNLKSRTLKILQVFALVSAAQETNLVKKKLDLCRKNFAIGQKFLGKNERKEGLRLIKQAYGIAVKYNFVHLACELSTTLYHNHVYYKEKPHRIDFYAAKVEQHLEDYLAEKKVEHQFYKIIGRMKLMTKNIPFKEVLADINKWSGKSLKCKAYHSMVEVLYGFEIKDYKLILRSCNQALNFFEGKNGVYSSHYHFFFTNKGIAQMATANYEGADESFINADKFAPAKSVNQYLSQLYRTINALHSGNYQMAYDLYRQNKNCKFKEIRQQFTLIEAYLCFLAHMGYLQLDKKFRIGKYLNETLKEQADKQGNNIIIIIAELLVYLARNRGKFIDRVESISNYSYRHLKGKDTMRAKRFIRILCTLPRANFNSIALQRKAQKHIQYLKEHPICMGENVAIEIIPFGVLLDMILVQLERKVA